MTLPFSILSPFSSTTLIVPRAALPKTGQFGLSAKPRARAAKIVLLAPAPPPASILYVQTKQGLVRSEAYEDWLDQTARRLAAQRPGRIDATYALDVAAPRNSRTRQFGAMERPLVELLARCRIIRRGLSPEKFSASYGVAPGGELVLTLSDAVSA
jgi:hypothetical protein